MRRDIVEQATMIKAKTEGRISALTDAGAKQLKLYCDSGHEPTADSGIFADSAEPWEAGRDYEHYELFSYGGNMGFVKQAHTSAEHWLPFVVGTEALYGARPKPDGDGVFPYVYNMSADVGMKVRDTEDGKVYECIQAIETMLYPPNQIPAHFLEVT